jgi:hypothetical protein
MVELMTDGSVEIERYHSVAGVESDPALIESISAEIVTE